MGGKFLAIAPHMKGMATPDEAVNLVMKVIDNATMEENGGRLVSKFGNREWL